jgi:hypothetical protein
MINSDVTTAENCWIVTCIPDAAGDHASIRIVVAAYPTSSGDYTGPLYISILVLSVGTPPS